ncbi:MAG TPA: type II toxin-antitoxin system RelE/ParE family toxin [Bacteroidetes bacterium]|nr:type II toxin-antitoxin system RelE/ParE family toxin [Bacteroidota bacterium]
MIKLDISEEANEDMFDIWYFIAIENANPNNADKFIEEFDEIFYIIARNPLIGAARDEIVKGIRQVVFRGYLIFYFPSKKGIEIIRILNGAKDILKEMKK